MRCRHATSFIVQRVRIPSGLLLGLSKKVSLLKTVFSIPPTESPRGPNQGETESATVLAEENLDKESRSHGKMQCRQGVLFM